MNSKSIDTFVTLRLVRYSYGGNVQSYGDMSPLTNDFRSDAPRSMVIVPGGVVIGGSTTLDGFVTGFSATKIRIDPLFAADFE